MLNELIAQAFCRETRRTLRRFGVLGLILSTVFAVYVELPVGISVVTKEAQAAMGGLQHSLERTLAKSKHHTLKMQRLQQQPARRGHPRVSVTNHDRAN
jgi:hypothetical protein